AEARGAIPEAARVERVAVTQAGARVRLTRCVVERHVVDVARYSGVFRASVTETPLDVLEILSTDLGSAADAALAARAQTLVDAGIAPTLTEARRRLGRLAVLAAGAEDVI